MQLFFILLALPTAYCQQLPVSADSLSIAPSANAVCPLKIGQKVPEVMVADTAGMKINLRENISNKPAVIIFYRGGWCPYCNRHLAELQEIEDTLIAMGFRIIALSPDKPEFLKESIRKEKLKYTLLSDSKMEAAAGFGIAYRVPGINVAVHKARGSALEKYSGEKHNLLPVPSVFIIGSDGTIKFEYVNPDYKIRLSSAVLLAAAKAALLERD